MAVRHDSNGGAGEVILLVDFGSTFTKVRAIDTRSERVIAASQEPTTVSEGITVGLEAALAAMSGRIGADAVRRARKLACSSAAGGLKMVAVGLVDELTAEAARRAALGAGARVLERFSGRLERGDVDELARLEPDVVLLAGGTDGGNRDVLLHNARLLGGALPEVPIVLAGNADVADEAKALLAASRSASAVRVAENVMPRLGTLRVESARREIRGLFMERIVDAKGLRAAEQWVEGVLMPTPAAVLKAAELLSKGTERDAGLGPLIVVDVGGATTDVHSLAAGEPHEGGVTVKGLPEPFAKRTVEGDLGVRVSAASLCESVGADRLGEAAGMAPDRVREAVVALNDVTSRLPDGDDWWALDRALASLGVEEAVGRHVGTLERVATPLGTIKLQRGKDLTTVSVLIGTGGVLVNSPDAARALRRGMQAGTQAEQAGPQPETPERLLPVDPGLFLDRDYMLSAMGLLAEIDPDLALRMMKRSLKRV